MTHTCFFLNRRHCSLFAGYGMMRSVFSTELSQTSGTAALFRTARKEKHMKTYTPVKEGKVREIYDIGDSLIMAATDRISAFDVILKNRIKGKGAVLTQMSAFWFRYTEDIIPNHMISTDPADMPEFFRTPEFAGRCMLVRKLRMLPVECIVRGYITGSGWKSYLKNGTVCGIRLPEGLEECQALPEPVYTPSTKAELGDHDENIDFERSVEVLEKEFPGHGREYASVLRSNQNRRDIHAERNRISGWLCDYNGNNRYTR